MESLVLVDPFRCRVWALHDRMEEHISEENCAAEIESFKEHGQLLPVLCRPIRDDPDHDVELICGARRLFVARCVNTKLLAEVRELSDREAIVAMDMENRQRRDISPYERGLSFARWLRGKHFVSQEAIAHALNISPSHVSRLLRLARLPSVVVGAFNAAIDIRESWGLKLAEILEDPQRRQLVIRAARDIRSAETCPQAREVYRKLLASSVPGRKPKASKNDRVVKGRNGRPLFRIKHQRRSIAIFLPVERTQAKVLEEIERVLVNILDECAVQPEPLAVERRHRRRAAFHLTDAPPESAIRSVPVAGCELESS